VSELDIDALFELGEVDRDLIATRRRLADAKRIAAPQQSRVNDAKAALQEVLDKSKRGGREVKSLEADAKAKEEEISKAQIALNNAKSNEEYQGHLRTIDRAKTELGELETRVLEAYEAQEHRDAEKKRLEERVEVQEAELAQAMTRVREAEGKEQAGLERHEARRAEIVGRLSGDHLELYERILEKHGDHATAEVLDEMCQGCYMRVRPEQLSQVRGRKAVVTCTTCGRILFRRPE